MASNASSAVLSLLVLLQIFGILVLGLGWLYLLFCLGRAANGLDRLASVAEAWLVWQQQSANADESRRAAETRVAETRVAETSAPVVLTEVARTEF